MKRTLYLGSFLVTVFLLSTFFMFRPEKVSAQVNSCRLAIYVKDKNNVTFEIGVSGGSGYPARFDFGDGGYVDLPSGEGQHIFHAYGYGLGQITAYTSTLTVPNVPQCQMAIGIDDRSTIVPFCNLYLVELGHNEFTIGADIAGAGSYPGHLDWGDNSSIDLPMGSGQNVHHAYSYTPGGITNYHVVLSVSGVQSCDATYTVDDAGGQSHMSETTPHTGSLPGGTVPESIPVYHEGTASSGGGSSGGGSGSGGQTNPPTTQDLGFNCWINSDGQTVSCHALGITSGSNLGTASYDPYIGVFEIPSGWDPSKLIEVRFTGYSNFVRTGSQLCGGVTSFTDITTGQTLHPLNGHQLVLGCVSQIELGIGQGRDNINNWTLTYRLN